MGRTRGHGRNRRGYRRLQFYIRSTAGLACRSRGFGIIIVTGTLRVVPRPRGTLGRVREILGGSKVLFTPAFICRENCPGLPV